MNTLDEKSYNQIMDENPPTWMKPISSNIMDELKKYKYKCWEVWICAKLAP
jgi:hypothetical protein